MPTIRVVGAFFRYRQLHRTAVPPTARIALANRQRYHRTPAVRCDLREKRRPPQCLAREKEQPQCHREADGCPSLADCATDHCRCRPLPAGRVRPFLERPSCQGSECCPQKRDDCLVKCDRVTTLSQSSTRVPGSGKDIGSVEKAISVGGQPPGSRN